jgi:hypothetical protein
MPASSMPVPSPVSLTPGCTRPSGRPSPPACNPWRSTRGQFGLVLSGVVVADFIGLILMQHLCNRVSPSLGQESQVHHYSGLYLDLFATWLLPRLWPIRRPPGGAQRSSPRLPAPCIGCRGAARGPWHHEAQHLLVRADRRRLRAITMRQARNARLSVTNRALRTPFRR